MKLILLAMFLICLEGSAQMALDEKELTGVVHKWNYAHNSRSEKTFLQLYADTLLFYTERVSAYRAVRLKKALFASYPDFQQRIISKIKFTPYTGGVIKADFVKEVIRDSVRKHYVSYVILDYQAGEYKIAGESDVATDKTLKFVLDVGTPMEFNSSSDDSTSTPVRSVATSVRTVKEFPDSMLEGEVTISKKYVFILIAILAFGALLVLLAPDRSRSRNLVATGKDTVSSRQLEQLAFKRFAQTLFDPLYFIVQDLKPFSEYVERYHLMHVIFKEKERMAEFDVLCVYEPSMAEFQKNIEGLKSDLASIKHEVYIVLGLKGSGENPEEVYLLPVNYFLSWSGDTAKLFPFKKWGMFFYSAEAKRLV